MTPNIGIIMPFYYLSDDITADAKTLQETIESTKYFGEIVVVDDGTQLTSVTDARLIKHGSNRGKSDAIRTGLEYILSNKNIGFIVEVDADNDQDPKEISKFIEKFKDKNPDDRYLVIGDRYFAPQMRAPRIYREAVNALQSLLFSQFGFSIRDSVSGFRGYSRAFANSILENSMSKGFGISTEEIIIAYLTNTIIEEIPLGYAKPRKNFTKAYKLGEVLEGLTLHSAELREKGHSTLLDCLNDIKTQIRNKADLVKFNLNGREFSFRYDDEAYTKEV
jgi:glycosyltransferase involved in cell wall biosynthesis